MTHRLIVGGDLALYGDVGDMWGDGSGFSGRDVLEALTEMKGDITVRLNSGGGLAFDGVAIFNALKAHKGKVTVRVDGIAASAASVILLAGETRIAAPGSMVMIHDPATFAMGAAADLRKTADTLDKLGETVASIYADRTGGDASTMRELMLAETWMNAEEAVAQGFATTTDDEEAKPVAAFDYAKYMHTPSLILQMAGTQRALPANTVAPATLTEKDDTMPEKAISGVAADAPAMNTPAPVATAPVAPTAPAKDVAGILARCTLAKLSLVEANDVIAKADTVAAAQDLIINLMAARDPSPSIGPAVVTLDGRDKFLMGVEKSLLGKVNLAGGERNEFTSMSLREIARASLVNAGVRVPHDPMEMIASAFRMSAGMHSTSDFTSILANVANKAMLKGYEEADETFERWTATGVLTDFKPLKRVDANLFPSLAAVPELGEYTYGTMGDRESSITLATYGKLFAISRQAIINDDLGCFSRVPMKMGRAAKRTIGNLVYAVITANAAMADTYALFSTQHANLAGTAATPTVASVDAARAAMALQVDPDSAATGGLNIRPAFALVPVQLEGKFKGLMATEFDPAGTQKNPNYVRGLVEVISDARLSTASALSWYLAANPATIDTIEVAYLNGNSTPAMEQKDGWEVDGVEFKVRIDAGVAVHDYRGLYKNAGA